MRVIYWNTSCLEPAVEAVSGEISALSRHFPDSLIFAVSPHLRLRLSPSTRTYGVHPALDPLLRLVIPVLERWGDVNHVIGDPCPWTYAKTLKRRPTVLTLTSEQGPVLTEFLGRCHHIVTQTAGFRKRLLEMGLAADQVTLCYPAIDLHRFVPTDRQPDDATPRLLFATAPRESHEMTGRGVYLLLETAAAHPDLHLRLLYRDWASNHTALAPTRDWLAQRDCPNVELTVGAEANMATLYPSYHFTVIPYTTIDGGKECPNSLLESLACGVPVLISEVAPFAAFVAEHDCGELFTPTADGLSQAVARGMARLPTLRANARKAAELHFDSRTALATYATLYERAMAAGTH